MNVDISPNSCIVVGAGPNGLAAAIEMASANVPVVVYESAATVGGGTRTEELTLPGFRHDVCAAVHPLALASPFFQTLPLERHGLTWIHPRVALAHPFDDGTAALLQGSIDATAETLGRDARAYGDLMAPVVVHWAHLADDILGPLHWPRHGIPFVRFGLQALRPAQSLATDRFRTDRARAFFVGLSAHSCLPPSRPPTTAFALVLAAAGHAAGWPIAAGGSHSISKALAAYLSTLDGRIVTSAEIRSVGDLPEARAVLLDVTPRQLLVLAGHQFNWLYRRQLGLYRYGPGVFKIDWALRGPVPWKAKECALAGTVHLGGTMLEIAAAEQLVARGRHPQTPFVIFAQQSLFDPSRAPAGFHTGWAYCHVPNGARFDMTERIERQVERFAPGFRDLIIARHTRTAAALELYDANCVGGDISGGASTLGQLFTRPAIRLDPYSTSAPGIFICSASTPPGGGVHGMCGYHAARSALRARFAGRKEG